jgi:TetR/AcrR family transcriptional repressor of nem operon
MARQAGNKKAETHERIVKAAAAAIRRHGFEGVSVADIMKDAGLTHGGFYAHFDSRETMLAEALDRAGGESLDDLARVTQSSRDPLEGVVQSYLSDRHLASPEGGCCLAALGSETRRQSAPVRKAATRRLKELVALIEKQLPPSDTRHDDALAVLSCLVGAMTMARLTEDASLGRSVRKAAGQLIRRSVHRH